MARTLKGQNSFDVQKVNRSLVIRTLNKQKITTRAEITELTGLNKATVTNIISDLIEWGTVREVGLSTGKSGRRTILIELNKDNYAIIGAWLKRNELITGVFDIYGQCRYTKNVIFEPNDNGEKVLQIMISELNKIILEVKSQKILGVAVALPGPYIKKEGKIVLITGRQKWMEEDIEKRLKNSLSVDVYTEHDANAATMAEWYYTCNSDEKANMMCIMVGHGVGGGIIENGRILSGALGTAGEIGHMSIKLDGRKCECGNYGCLETYCTIEAMMSDFSQLSKDYPHSLCNQYSTVEDIFDAYHKGDQLAKHVVERIGEYLGYGIVNAINVFNPKQIIIGDELPEAGGKEFLGCVKKIIKNRVLPQIYDQIEISLSTLENSVLKGICICLLEELMNEPEKFKFNN